MNNCEKEQENIIDTKMNTLDTITSLEVAEMMETEHYKIIRKLEGSKDRKGIIQILTETQMGVSDYFIPSTYRDSTGKENKCYRITRLGCDFLANKFTGEKGILFTARYVKRFHEMEEALKPKLPQTYLEALKALVASEEEKQQLLLENKQLKPMADDWKTFMDTKGTYSVLDIAHAMNVGRNTLFEMLRNVKICFLNERKENIPYEKPVHKGKFTTCIVHKNGMPCTQMRVYPKGISYITKKLREKGYIDGDKEQHVLSYFTNLNKHCTECVAV